MTFEIFKEFEELRFIDEQMFDGLIRDERLQFIEYSPKSNIASTGDVHKNICKLIMGSVRQFAFKEGEEINFLFYFDNEYFFDELSFYGEIPSKYTFQTLEKTTILVIDKSVFELSKNNFESKDLLFSLSRQNVERLYKRNEVLLMDTAEQRYLKLLEIHPKIMEKVSLAKIASFLGIAAPSLSRIRKRIVSF